MFSTRTRPTQLRAAPGNSWPKAAPVPTFGIAGVIAQIQQHQQRCGHRSPARHSQRPDDAGFQILTTFHPPCRRLPRFAKSSLLRCRFLRCHRAAKKTISTASARSPTAPNYPANRRFELHRPRVHFAHQSSRHPLGDWRCIWRPRLGHRRTLAERNFQRRRYAQFRRRQHRAMFSPRSRYKHRLGNISHSPSAITTIVRTNFDPVGFGRLQPQRHRRRGRLRPLAQDAGLDGSSARHLAPMATTTAR